MLEIVRQQASLQLVKLVPGILARAATSENVFCACCSADAARRRASRAMIGSTPSRANARTRRASSLALLNVTDGRLPRPISRRRPPVLNRRTPLRAPDSATCSARPSTPPTLHRPGV